MAPNQFAMTRDSSLTLLSPRAKTNFRERNFSTVRGGNHKPIMELSVSDMTGQKNELFGIRNYSIPRNEPLIPLEKRKIPLGKSDKSKNLSFAEQIINKKKWVPGPQYQQIDNWNNLLPKRTGMFGKKAKVTETMEVMKRGAKLPSPSQYNPEVWKKQAGVNRVLGNYKQKEDIITFAQESINTFGDNPLNKYEAMELNKIRKKPRYTVINKDIERFSKQVKDRTSPSSATYDVL